MLKSISKFFIFILIAVGSFYIIPKFFQQEVIPTVLKYETDGIPTYEISNYADYSNAILSSIKNLEPNINLIFKDKYLEDSSDMVLNAADELIRTLGPGNYIRKYSITHKKSSLYEYYTISYNFEKDLNEIRKQSEKINSLIESIVSKITNSSMSDLQKEKAIHDYIVETTRYDKENFENGTTPIESHTPYGVLVNKTAVCEGYATAMKKMLDAADVESLIVVGKADGYDHAWNLVKLNNKWYHADATWDDPIYTVNGKLVDIVSYDYFNLTDAEMKRTHTWNEKNYPRAK